MFLNSFCRVALFSVLIFSVACKSNVQPENEETTPADEAPVDADSRLKFQKLMLDMATPGEVVTTFSNAKIPYNAALLRPIRSELEYPSSIQKSLNYGGYLADLCYISLSDRNQELLSYFESSRKFAKSLSVEICFEEVTNSRFEKNIGNKDSMLNIMNAAFKATNTYLISNQRLETATQIYAGSWIEGFYLITNLLKNQKESATNKMVFQKFRVQKTKIKELIQLLYDFKENTDVKYLIVELESLEKTFAGIPNDFSKNDLQQLSEKVGEIREGIIKGH